MVPIYLSVQAATVVSADVCYSQMQKEFNIKLKNFTLNIKEATLGSWW